MELVDIDIDVPFNGITSGLSTPSIDKLFQPFTLDTWALKEKLNFVSSGYGLPWNTQWFVESASCLYKFPYLKLTNVLCMLE